MSKPDLAATARAMVANGKGLLAMDESNPTCNKRFGALGIPQTEPSRRAYRDLIVTTLGLADAINAAILADETIRQKTHAEIPFADALVTAGIIPGIKVDRGAKDMPGFPGEKITAGLDGLGGRLVEYSAMGARFAKWRAVIAIGDGIPTDGCIDANAHALARYAAICQNAGIVPIVEPEVIMEGDHDLDRCAKVTGHVLHAVFDQLYRQRVALEGMILKPNMVVPGNKSPRAASVEEVADATIHCLLRSVPAAVAGIAFLSGGQPGEIACARLNAMNARFANKLPWPVTYSFSRAIQHPALDIWSGHEDKIAAAQKSLLHRALCSRAARRGEYTAAMEKI